MKDTKRYSMAFKLKVMEELRDGKWKTVADAATISLPADVEANDVTVSADANAPLAAASAIIAMHSLFMRYSFPSLTVYST